MQIQTLIKAAEKQFAFHYVSILILFQLHQGRPNIQIYIPLCLYFNQYNSFTWFSFNLIYIPLCLYFNRICVRYLCFICVIYIPLCLYFNATLHLILLHAVDIYIPLCLYFNYFVLQLNSLFGRHLHSIMSLF